MLVGSSTFTPISTGLPLPHSSEKKSIILTPLDVLSRFSSSVPVSPIGVILPSFCSVIGSVSVSVTAFLFSFMASFTVFQYASMPSASVRFSFHLALSCKYFSLLVVMTGLSLVRLSTSFCALVMLASTNASISSSSSEPSIRSATVVSIGALW